MQGDSVEAGQNDDQSWYINLYGTDESGATRRETLADNLTEHEARQLIRPLRKLTQKLCL